MNIQSDGKYESEKNLSSHGYEEELVIDSSDDNEDCLYETMSSAAYDNSPFNLIFKDDAPLPPLPVLF